MAWDNSLDEDTLVSNYDDGQQIHVGPARVRPTSAQIETVGDSVMLMRNAQITFPYDIPQIRRNDMIRVIDSPTKEVQGRWFQVTEERIAGQEGFTTVQALSIAPSRLWRGGNVDVEAS
jgi:hypothetical protein